MVAPSQLQDVQSRQPGLLSDGPGLNSWFRKAQLSGQGRTPQRGSPTSEAPANGVQFLGIKEHTALQSGARET